MPSYDVNNLSPFLQHAEREILKTYGDKVSFAKKAKSLHKFGNNELLTNAGYQTVWQTGGDEVYVNDNLIDTIVSDSPADIVNMKIEGHTVTGTGENQQFTFVAYEVTTNGTTPVTLPTPLARVGRLYNNNGVPISGTITVTDSGTGNIHVTANVGDEQSLKAATTFSNNDYFALTEWTVGVSNKQAANVDFRLQVREAGKVFRTVSELTSSTGGGEGEIKYDPPLIIKKNSDIRVIAISSIASDTAAYTLFKGYLAEVVS